MRPCGSSEPSRRAATGGTRVARRAGAREASSVTIVPTAIGSDTVRGWMVSAAGGRPNPTASNSAPAASRSGHPTAMPISGRDEPDRERLAQDAPQDLPPHGTDGAQHRELPHALGDRDREGVEDDERAHEHGGTGECQEGRGEERVDAAGDLVGLLLGGLGAGLHLHRARHRGDDALLELAGRDPRVGLHRDVEVFPTRSYHSCASAKVVDTTVVPPIEDTPPPKSKMPEIVTRWTPSSVVQPDLLADVEVLVVGLLLGDRHLAAGRREVALDDRVLVERLGLRWRTRAQARRPGRSRTSRSRPASRPPGSGRSPAPRRGTCLTWSISAASSGPTWAVSPPAPLPNAGRLLMNTSVPEKAFPKMSEKAFSIWSVMTNVPAIIAVPRTIANAVSVERSLWLRSPRSVKRVMSSRSGPSWRGSRRRPCPTRRARSGRRPGTARGRRWRRRGRRASP